MTLYEFNQLSDEEKANFTWRHSTYLASRVEDSHHSANLYHYCQGSLKAEFFIEVWYNVGDNRIDSIIAFRTTRKLKPYLKRIKLDGLR